MGMFDNIRRGFYRLLTGEYPEDTDAAMLDAHSRELDNMRQRQEFFDGLEQAALEMQELNDKLDICNEEDHSMEPTDEDIERYYWFHTRYVEGIEIIRNAYREEKNVWATKSVDLLDRDTYNEKASEGGWLFLRESAGFAASGDVRKSQEAWCTNTPEWQTEEESWDAAPEAIENTSESVSVNEIEID